MAPDVTVGDEELLVGVEDEEAGVEDEDAPDVTEPDEEVLVGLDEDAAPVLPLVPVVPEPAEVLFEELWVFAAVDSWATTTPRKTVAPAAATMAPRVSVRTRAWARSRPPGVFGWVDSDMG